MAKKKYTFIDLFAGIDVLRTVSRSVDEKYVFYCEINMTTIKNQ